MAAVRGGPATATTAAAAAAAAAAAVAAVSPCSGELLMRLRTPPSSAAARVTAPTATAAAALAAAAAIRPAAVAAPAAARPADASRLRGGFGRTSGGPPNSAWSSCCSPLDVFAAWGPLGVGRCLRCFGTRGVSVHSREASTEVLPSRLVLPPDFVFPQDLPVKEQGKCSSSSNNNSNS
ncbi:uncharacterized protein EMH_0013850 [Eimeria mitis]|uniref:Uncharacterized protein n=1 Tax=Eimeria mitis TaxID=44415 RepID=U6K7N6_9EIME|nr:uncharacterized protein EMH_0013850 [Eimeria mitis]CDJ32826.1 hypothetical protein EMH_0013850 [Eimeria mitis]